MPTVALCMIARDEAPVIGAALESARGFVDEMVVVDTGSVDDTAAVAASHGARVVRARWNDSFAEARNVYLDQARADWILVLDADEALDPGAPALLRACMRTAEMDGRTCLYQLRLQGHERFVTRFFPRRPELRYRGRIHEDLAHARGEAAVERIGVRAAIHHYGHAASERAERHRPVVEKAVVDVLEDGFAQFNLGRHRFEQGDAERALEHLRRSCLLDPSSARVVPYMASRFVVLAEVLRRLGHADEAMRELQSAVALFPALPDARFHLGNLLMERQDYAGAEQAYRLAIQLSRRPLPSLFGLYDTAIGQWKARMQLGLVLGQLGRWQEALPCLREVVERAPEVPLAMLALGLCHFHVGACAEALRIWARVDLETLAPPDVLCRKAEAQVRCGLLEDALDTAWMAAVRHPFDADARLAEARVRLEAGDRAGAFQAYRDALARTPDANGWLEYGELAAEMGLGEVSEDAFRRAAELDPSRADTLTHLAGLALNRGDVAGARELLEKALKGDPGYDPAAWCLARVWLLTDQARRALDLLRHRLKLGRRRIADMIACYHAWRSGTMEDSPVRYDPVPGVMLAITAATRTDCDEDAMAWMMELKACGPPSTPPVTMRRREHNLEEVLAASIRWMQAAANPLAVVHEAELAAAWGRVTHAGRVLGSSVVGR